jgi:hypothetical protein
VNTLPRECDEIHKNTEQISSATEREKWMADGSRYGKSFTAFRTTDISISSLQGWIEF